MPEWLPYALTLFGVVGAAFLTFLGTRRGSADTTRMQEKANELLADHQQFEEQKAISQQYREQAADELKRRLEAERQARDLHRELLELGRCIREEALRSNSLTETDIESLIDGD